MQFPLTIRITLIVKTKIVDRFTRVEIFTYCNHFKIKIYYLESIIFHQRALEYSNTLNWLFQGYFAKSLQEIASLKMTLTKIGALKIHEPNV